MHKINLTHQRKKGKRTKPFLQFFENFHRDFGTLGLERAKIPLESCTRRPRNKSYTFYVNLAVFFLQKIVTWYVFCQPLVV